ncbi:barwin-like endoglucanase [Chlorella sorokiniana]|uniref:Barwin-like endoglucanase n=1 Tax=Chlorella sorokiniana TaxID=3076 RepID=A0A2P6TPK5_CHLSO|nr:barwin-like endoglucanase [Chlorella sorokiniana]|eukprot:PRW55961.1 barwin-like endoglucanase [Chlorella sorokiniana]
MLLAGRQPGLLLVLLLAALLPLGRAQQQADGGWLTGTLGELGFGTTYAPEQGACGYGALPPDQWPFGGIAAIDPLASPFAVGVQQGCGVCLEVQCTDPTACGTSQSLVVLVTDHCDGCGASAVYLAPSAFGQLVPGPLGSVAGRVRRVNCSPPGPIAVAVDQWQVTGGSWLRLSLKDVAGSGDIVGVSLAPSAPEQQQQQTVQLVTGQPEVSPQPLAATAPSPEAVVPPVGAPLSPPAFTLPPPAPAAPEIVDTRPPRPPGVGPSITPAPVVYSPETGLPTVRKLPATSGPASPSQLVDPGFEASCSTIGEVLGRIPEASNWTQLVNSAGLNILLQSKTAQVTLLVPINSALSAELDARPLRAERNLSELVLNAPEIVNPLVGYHVLPRLWPSFTLLPGTAINTSDTIDKVNRLQVTALGPTALQGIGSSARILQGDLAACGPSVIHVVDQVLLPFTFNQSAIDAITGTQVPLSQASTQLPAAGRR